MLDAAACDAGTARLACLVGNYIDARYYQEALAITRQNIATREETLELVQRQRASGTATDLDVLRTQALLDDASLAADL